MEETELVQDEEQRWDRNDSNKSKDCNQRKNNVFSGEIPQCCIAIEKQAQMFAMRIKDTCSIEKSD